MHAAKKVGKESGFTPPAYKCVPWLGGGSGASGICVFAHSALVTRQSCFPPRTACSPEGSGPTQSLAITRGGAIGCASARCSGVWRGGAEMWGAIGACPGQGPAQLTHKMIRKPNRTGSGSMEGGVENDRCGARSVAGRMTALSRGWNVRGHGFQMHHCPLQARAPLMSWRLEPAFFAYFLCGGKESKCRPAQGQR